MKALVFFQMTRPVPHPRGALLSAVAEGVMYWNAKLREAQGSSA